MSNVKSIFCSEFGDLQLFANDQNKIFISIESDGYAPSFVVLDKPTAIKLSRVLRAEIAKLDWNE
jgi:hypothetical protein